MVNTILIYESILPELCEIRSSQTAAALRLFAKTYFPHYQKVPPSIMHQELYDMLQKVDEQASQRIAVAAPRGNAKSTLVSLFFILWIICTEREKYVLLLSDTKDKAAQFLANVREELQTNEKLRKDYPHVCELPGRRPAPRRWRESRLETRNGCCITAAGAGQSLRGSKFQTYRPGLIILDDIENEENTATPEAREKMETWFNRTVLKAGNPQTHIVMVGTIQHYDSLLAKLTSTKMSSIWESRIYRSIIHWSEHHTLWEQWTKILHGHEPHNGKSGLDGAKQFFIDHQQDMLKNTQVLWPELEDYHQLMIMRETEGHWAFNAEKQNEPVNKEDCLFDPDEFYYWDDQYSSAEELIDYVY